MYPTPDDCAVSISFPLMYNRKTGACSKLRSMNKKPKDLSVNKYSAGPSPMSFMNFGISVILSLKINKLPVLCNRGQFSSFDFLG